MPGMTMTEKILAKHSGKSRVEPGENVWVNVDVLMTHDVCGPGTIGVFKREFGKIAKVWDRKRIVIIPDHYIFTADSKSNRMFSRWHGQAEDALRASGIAWTMIRPNFSWRTFSAWRRW